MFSYESAWWNDAAKQAGFLQKTGVRWTVLNTAVPVGSTEMVPSMCAFWIDTDKAKADLFAISDNVAFTFAYSLESLYRGAVELYDDPAPDGWGIASGSQKFDNADDAVKKFADFTRFAGSSVLVFEDCQQVLAGRLAVLCWLQSVTNSQFYQLIELNGAAFPLSIGHKIKERFFGFGNGPDVPPGKLEQGYVFPWLNPLAGAGYFKFYPPYFRTQYEFSGVPDKNATIPQSFLSTDYFQVTVSQASPPWQNWIDDKTEYFSKQNSQSIYRTAGKDRAGKLAYSFHTGWLWDTNPIIQLRYLLLGLSKLPQSTYEMWRKHAQDKNPDLQNAPAELLTVILAAFQFKEPPVDLSSAAGLGFQSGNVLKPHSSFVASGDQSTIQVVATYDLTQNSVGNRAQIAQFAQSLLSTGGLSAYFSPCNAATAGEYVASWFSVELLGLWGTSIVGTTEFMALNGGLAAYADYANGGLQNTQFCAGHTLFDLGNSGLMNQLGWRPVTAKDLINSIIPVFYFVKVVDWEPTYSEIEFFCVRRHGGCLLPSGDAVGFSNARWLDAKDFSLQQKLITYLFVETEKALLLMPSKYFTQPFQDLATYPGLLNHTRSLSIVLSFSRSLIDVAVLPHSEGMTPNGPTSGAHTAEFTTAMVECKEWAQMTVGWALLAPAVLEKLATFVPMAGVGPTMEFFTWLNQNFPDPNEGTATAVRNVLRCTHRFFSIVSPTQLLPTQNRLGYYRVPSPNQAQFKVAGAPGNLESVDCYLSSNVFVAVSLLFLAFRIQKYYCEELTPVMDPLLFQDINLGPP